LDENFKLMKIKQIFRNLLLGGLLVTTFVGFQSVKGSNNGKYNSKSTKKLVYYQHPCPITCVGVTCRINFNLIHCPENWDQNPNYGCTCN